MKIKLQKVEIDIDININVNRNGSIGIYNNVSIKTNINNRH